VNRQPVLVLKEGAVGVQAGCGGHGRDGGHVRRSDRPAFVAGTSRNATARPAATPVLTSR
jgi:hypothetical protein